MNRKRSKRNFHLILLPRLNIKIGIDAVEERERKKLRTSSLWMCDMPMTFMLSQINIFLFHLIRFYFISIFFKTLVRKFGAQFL